ncbi:MAG: redoxin domain-containing protein [Deltaproteobacteria bacterium]|jgi:thiol-disulfide isomerase/thioredoxin|nr:redoxin domain-containing protein [Deltaproteobacteria bacterium]
MKLLAIVFVLFAFLFSVESSFAEKPPKFWIKNLEGKRFNSKKQKSVYVVSFFFVNCAPCIKEIPVLHKLMSTNYPDVPLLFIDPIKEDSKNDIKKFSNQLKVPLSYFYKDSFGSISKKFFKGKMAFPTIVGISGNEYLFRFNGIDESQLEKIKSLL